MPSVEIRGQEWLRLRLGSFGEQDLKEHIACGNELLEELLATLENPDVSSMQKAANRALIKKIQAQLEKALHRQNELRADGGDGSQTPMPSPIVPKKPR